MTSLPFTVRAVVSLHSVEPLLVLFTCVQECKSTVSKSDLSWVTTRRLRDISFLPGGGGTVKFVGGITIFQLLP